MTLIALVVAVTSAVSAWLLVSRTGPAGARAARFMAAGTATAALSTVGAAAAARYAPDAFAMDVPLPAEIPNVGLFFTAGPYLIGLLLVPDAAPGTSGRVRRGLDGVGAGLCAFFAAWLLVFTRVGLRGAGLTAVLVASIGVAAAIAVRPRAAVFAAAGPVVSIVGLAGLTLCLDYHARPLWTLIPGAALAAGPPAAWYGMRAVTGGRDRPAALDGGARLIGYPLVSLPLLAAVLAAGYHLLRGRPFDPTSIVLSLVGVAVIAVRETLAALEVRRYAGRLAALETHFRSLVAGRTDVTVVLDAGLAVRWQSPAAARQLGLSDQDVVGRPLVDRVHPEDAERVARGLTSGERTLIEARLRDGYGAWRDTEWSVNDQGAGGIVVHVRDVGERKELERSLHRAASADPLTGLPNRRELCRALRGSTGPVGVVLIGLGGVTGVHHIRGHQVGEAVLVEAARRLRAGLSRAHLPARLSGDTFAVLVPGGRACAQPLATRLLARLAEPYPLPGGVAHLSASAGLAEADTDPDEVLRRAELALRRAGGGVGCYDASIDEALSRRLAIEHELPGALARGELDLVYQAIVGPAGSRPVGVEALVRWRHPSLGTVDVDAALSGIDEIGEWMLHWTCRQLAGWERDGVDLWASVTVPAGQLAVPAVLGALQVHRVPAARLVIGIADPGEAAAAAVDELRAIGVRVASTSLRHVRALPIDVLKVDPAVLDTVGRLGGRIGVQVVAPLGEPEPAERISAHALR